jgi:hypothetical protein
LINKEKSVESFFEIPACGRQVCNQRAKVVFQSSHLLEGIWSNPSVMGSSNTNVPLYLSLEKRGKGRFSQDNFKIPLYPPLPKGDKNTCN